jgi:hypothetical protein
MNTYCLSRVFQHFSAVLDAWTLISALKNIKMVAMRAAKSFSEGIGEQKENMTTSLQLKPFKYKFTN